MLTIDPCRSRFAGGLKRRKVPEITFGVPNFSVVESQPYRSRIQSALTHSQPEPPKPEPPKPCAQRPNRFTQGFVLCAQPPDLCVQLSRPRSDEVRSIARDAFRVGLEGFSVASDRLTFALAIGALRTPSLSALRFGVFHLRVGGGCARRSHGKEGQLREH